MRLLSLFNDPKIFIYGGPTQPTYPRKLTDIHLLCSKSRIMLIKDRRNIVLRRRLASHLNSLALRIPYARANPRTDHLKLKLGEDASHLHECLRHGINLPVPAIDGDTVHDDQP